MGVIKMEHVNLFLVFTEGILSLFSLCILPVLPVYLSMLSNSNVQSLKDGEVKFINSPLLKNNVK
jgi:cytochrome c-type biogenesis protein